MERQRAYSEALRRHADALEARRGLENIDGFRRTPEHDQQLLLSLNAVRNKQFPVLPEAGDIVSQIKESVTSITLNDQESTSLGIFFTNADPTNKKRWYIVAGIFPLHGEIESYQVLPNIRHHWDDGEIIVSDPTVAGDPFLIEDRTRPDLLFFKRSPFSKDQLYKTCPQGVGYNACQLPRPTIAEQALEANVIERARFYHDNNLKPALFVQDGFTQFRKDNRHNPRYEKLLNMYREHRKYMLYDIVGNNY